MYRRSKRKAPPEGFIVETKDGQQHEVLCSDCEYRVGCDGLSSCTVLQQLQEPVEEENYAPYYMFVGTKKQYGITPFERALRTLSREFRGGWND